MLGKMCFQPSSALRIGDCVCCDRGHICQSLSGLHCQNKSHRHHVFANNPEFRRHRQRILGGTHATLNAVLDGDHGEVTATRKNIVQGFAHVVDTDPFLTRGSRNLPQGLPSEGAYRA